ncbi:MAG: N-acetylmuramoyl-L-alanine amidase [Oscillospiraceae bacterium]|nr:N-acetylmuramoyl-L-alanine amidase [Oscillospiraceae bacterium]
MKVCIDAGHGGSASGAVNGNALEKENTLLIAKEVKAAFEKRGVAVVMTRTEDVYLTMDQRCQIERASGAACCISLHMDSAGPTASGMTAWLHSKAPERYTVWAKGVLAALKAVGYTSNRAQEVNRGYRGNTTADYAWNAGTKSPSMLLELGFISNAKNLSEFEKNHAAYAEAIAKATCEWLGVEEPEADGGDRENRRLLGIIDSLKELLKELEAFAAEKSEGGTAHDGV